MKYNHFERMLNIAIADADIKHSTANPRYIRTQRIEENPTLTAAMAGKTGTILIAVDGSKTEMSDNGADLKIATREYQFVVASIAEKELPETIADASVKSSTVADRICKQLLDSDPKLVFTEKVFEVSPFVGLFDDRFYGVHVKFKIIEPA